MKKSFIIIFIVCIIAFIVGYNIYDNNRKEEIGEFIIETLNGYEISEESKNIGEVVYNWGIEYQDSNFYPNDYNYELFSGVSEFNEYIPFMHGVSEFIENDPFVVIENIPEYNTPEMELYFPYFNAEELNYDSRVFEENNKYFIKVSELNYDTTGYDYITYGHFHIYVGEKDVSKDTFAQRQAENRFSMIGVVEEDEGVLYKIFDTELNDSIYAVVDFGLFSVNSCYIK